MLPSVNLEPSATAPTDPATRLTRDWGTWVALGAFAVLWLDLIRQLSYNWSSKEQYAYGWFVPILSLGLLWNRWTSRPVQCARGNAVGFPFLLPAFVFLLLLLLLPLRVIHEVNQDWPLISWPLTLCVVGITLYAIYLAGDWPWVKCLAFPVCFILVAVQWPNRLENPLTNGLMQIVAGINVELLSWFDIPAMQRGNLIDLASCTVGVDEACSGIRSFQSSLMAALFLGELYLLRWPSRLLLAALGLSTAFLLNVVRTFILSYQAAGAGLVALEKWHDRAGFTIAIACFFVLWLISGWIKKKTRPAGRPEASTFNPNGLTLSSGSRPLFLHAKRFALVVGVWSLLCIGATELWYRSHESKEPVSVRWSVRLPEAKPTFQTIKFSPRTQKLLGCDASTAAKWQEEDGSEWTAYFLQWEGKSTQSIMAARYHRPEVCLPATGLQQRPGSKTDYFETASLKLPFQQSSYSAPGQLLFVFYCIWQDGDERRKGMRSRNPADRLIGPLEGKRRFGQQVLEIITTGYADGAEAERALRKRLPDLVQIVGPARSMATAVSH